jgi:ADP-heptose:LPS heptosyltransferase
MKKILVIKLGALGDFVQAVSTFKALRQEYPTACLHLLTTPPYEAFAKALSLFDHVYTNGRFRGIQEYLHLRTQISKEKYDTIVDLQGVDRTNLLYMGLMLTRTRWIGNPPFKISPLNYHKTHPKIRFENLLLELGIFHKPKLDLTFIKLPKTKNHLDKPYIMIIAGASHEKKRWPISQYSFLIQKLIHNKIIPVIIGTSKDNLDELTKIDGVVSLIDQTNIFDIVSLSKNATAIIGNDTGPQLIAASSGAKTLTLYFGQHGKSIGGAYGEHTWDLYTKTPDELQAHDVFKTIIDMGIINSDD